MGLKLRYPIKVQGSSTELNTESAPVAQMVQYTFPARDNLPKLGLPEVKVTWYDGGLLPVRPEELGAGEVMGRDWNGGVLFIGSKGKLMCGCYGMHPWIMGRETAPAPQVLRRIPNAMDGGHELDWIRACKESPENRLETSSNFQYSGPMNEMVVMGVLAVRLQDLKRELLWDGENMKFLNIDEKDEIRVITTNKFTVIDGDPKFDTKTATLNAKQAAESYVKHNYREGWTLPEMPS
jgi:hypothetical protein